MSAYCECGDIATVLYDREYELAEPVCNDCWNYHLTVIDDVPEARQEVVDCRSETGITIGLIDSIIAISRVLAKRDLTSSNEVAEALSDLRSDEDLRQIMKAR